MLLFIFILAFLGLCAVSLGVFLKSSKTAEKVFSLALVIIIFVITVLAAFPGSALKNPTISNTEIEAVYKDESGYFYVRKTGETDMVRLKADNVYKGDQNYVIKYTYPNMTDSYSFWFDVQRTTYDLVLTDLNVKPLPKFN